MINSLESHEHCKALFFSLHCHCSHSTTWKATWLKLILFGLLIFLLLKRHSNASSTVAITRASKTQLQLQQAAVQAAAKQSAVATTSTPSCLSQVPQQATSCCNSKLSNDCLLSFGTSANQSCLLIQCDNLQQESCGKTKWCQPLCATMLASSAWIITSGTN